MRFRLLAALLSAIALAPGFVASTAGPAPELRTIVGIVDTADAYDGFIVFDLDHIDQRFAFAPRDAATAAAIAELLAASRKTSRSLSVHYFVDGATIRFGETKPIYRIHDIVYDGKTMQIDSALPPPDPGAVPLPRDVAAASLARGIALSGDPDSAEARSALTIAANSEALEPSLRILALKSRREVDANDGLQNWPPGLARDRLFMAVLADSRAWQAMAPDDKDAASAVASALDGLGADDEAIAAQREIMRRWPDDVFWQEIRIASIYRRRGDTAQALAALDDLVRRAGPQEGMAYHYHRGWILLKAGRDQDAIDEFTTGMADQPDFNGAFMQRACALASLGRIDEALADWRQVIALRAQWGNDVPLSAGVKHDIEYQDDVEKRLEAAHASASHAPIPAVCSGGWDWGDDSRTRSPLLPAKG